MTDKYLISKKYSRINFYYYHKGIRSNKEIDYVISSISFIISGCFSKYCLETFDAIFFAVVTSS